VGSEPPLRLIGEGTTMIDACVLLDVLTDDSTWSAWSQDAIAKARDSGSLVINPIIYAEVAAGFDRIEEVDEAMPRQDFDLEPLPYEAGFLASRAFVRYRRSGGERRSPLPDFYIGAHAAVKGHRLLTRDAAWFRDYFPTVRLVTPDARD
jgi:predicted nucleic acid-binding protein